MSSELVTVGVETSLGALYSFPDMERDVLDKLIMRGPNNELVLEQVLLTNASRAVLSVPARIIQKITIDGEVWWETPC